MLSQLNTPPRLRWRAAYNIARSQRYFDAEFRTTQDVTMSPVSFWKGKPLTAPGIVIYPNVMPGR
jgi:hypothetical protein